MEGDTPAVETAPVTEAPVVAPAPVEAPAPKPKPTLETTYSEVDWTTIPPEAKEKLQAEMDRRIEVARKNAASRAKKETEAFYKGRESVRPVEAPKETQAPADKEPVRGDFATYEEFLDAKADYRGRQAADTRIAARDREAQEKTASEARLKAQQEFQEKLTAKYPDIADRAEAIGTITLPAGVSDAIQTSEVGPEILNFFADNPKECERIAALTPPAAIREIGKLEARFEAQEKKEPPKAEKKPSAAPEPIAPVGGKAVTGDREPSHDNPEAWAAWRNKQVLARRTGTHK